MTALRNIPRPGAPGPRVDLTPARLVEAALRRGEGILTETGALAVQTGRYTGRSPKDRFIVADDVSRRGVDFGAINQPFEKARFHRLLGRVNDYLAGGETFVFNGTVGASPEHRLSVKVITEYAWHSLFARNLFIRYGPGGAPPAEADWTIISAPGFQADPERDGTASEAFVIISFEDRTVLIGGTRYAGEIKKSVFSVMNYILPPRGVLPMHCSANQGADGRTALFFGLSGTGKTTLSTDPNRPLIGDDEHAWFDGGIFNFEGGCYAKCIDLHPDKEPLIYDAIRFGAVLENVVVDEDSRVPDYSDGSLTENTRTAYPLDYIPGAVRPSVGGHPSAVIFLTADASGVLPPIAVLSPEQAMYHFLSGYTSKLAGTERGVTEPEATFSPCFGEPFLPRRPGIYARMLGEKLERHGTKVFLVNTGWSGGPYGVGRRIELAYTRAMVTAALGGELDGVETRRHPVFGLEVPARCPGVPDEVFDPRAQWGDKAAYDEAARRLAGLFAENFSRFDGDPDLPDGVAAAGPNPR